ncbi:hypothetical protein OHV05_35210 (plasmid) [Kitasatospora sp. NBC_00070]|uniref:hypothetical protein n=1 Tax=Kitasatospora sp. NBC_00070 TaxID=2975962 RepID=UPI00324D1628
MFVPSPWSVGSNSELVYRGTPVTYGKRPVYWGVRNRLYVSDDDSVTRQYVLTRNSPTAPFEDYHFNERRFRDLGPVPSKEILAAITTARVGTPPKIPLGAPVQ